MDVKSFVIGHSKGYNKGYSVGKNLAGVVSMEENEAGGMSYELKANEEDTSLRSKGVDFYDYDGTLLYSYTVEEAQELTELPALPAHSGLICQEWNWTLEEIKSHNREVDVGANYITDDGKTRFYIRLVHPEQLNVELAFDADYNGDTVVINWGDGTGDVVYEVPAGQTDVSGCQWDYNAFCPSHTYESIGDYVIAVDSGKELGFGYYTKTVTDNNINGQFIFRKIEFGERVNRLGGYCFQNAYNLETVTIPKDMRGRYNTGGSYGMFKGCMSLKCITFPRYTTYGTVFVHSSFSDCCALQRVLLPGNLLNIDKDMFKNCYSLHSITIPDSVKRIDSSVFYGAKLEKIVLPEQVTTVNDYTFRDNYSLREIVVVGEPKQYLSGAFQSCYVLKHVELSSEMTTIPTYLFYNCYNLNSVAIPDGVTSIASSAFANCRSLAAIQIPENVTSIESSALSGCYSLYNVNLPGGITSIGSSAFSQCTSLQYIDFSQHTTVPTLSNTNAFYNTPTTCEIRVPSALYDEWIAATNWSSLASKIVAV